MNDLEIQFIKDAFGTTENHTLDEAFNRFHQIFGIDVDELKAKGNSDEAVNDILRRLQPDLAEWISKAEEYN